MLKGRIVIALVAVFAIIGAGCSGDTETTTTGGGATGDDVVFGEGTLPETIPTEFPLPTGSAIGSTMVVGQTGFTEVIVRISAEQGIAAEFFSQGLAQNGFTVERSEADGEGWAIEFSDDAAKGTIDVTEPVEGVSQAVIRYNVP